MAAADRQRYKCRPAWTVLATGAFGQGNWSQREEYKFGDKKSLACLMETNQNIIPLRTRGVFLLTVHCKCVRGLLFDAWILLAAERVGQQMRARRAATAAPKVVSACLRTAHTKGRQQGQKAPRPRAASGRTHASELYASC